MKTIAVIMAGGSGERFWPVSTEDLPKQLLKLTASGRTMLEDSLERLDGIFERENVFIATSQKLHPSIRTALPDFPEENIFAEPAKRNTAGALVWAVGSLLARLEGEPFVLAILTSDHRIEPPEKFRTTVQKALRLAQHTEGLVTLGIPPTRPATGFGYIEVGEPVDDLGAKVKRFTEKPTAEVAKGFLEKGNYLWNAGMFFWTSAAFQTELIKASEPHANALISISVSIAANDLDEARLLFEKLPTISIDHALIERSDRVYVVPAEFEWDDVGSWDALERSMPKDEAGNTWKGDGVAIEATGNIVFNDSTHQRVHLLGVEDLIVVVTDSGILVCPKSRAQEVKRLV